MRFNVPNLPIENRLLRHLVWIGIIKIILLFFIWFAFFRGHKVHVDPQSAAQQILQPTSNTNLEDKQP
ncbi:cytochrome oxidase putative small subunit CydP [Luteimonas sp. FXH3W]|uniref:Cytochrome oxidase putative small subunit CydP n=1 Tax=Aquilutibacter rugosus TaxID=3115820 RepID=A0ABU7UWM8_9GAMM